MNGDDFDGPELYAKWNEQYAKDRAEAALRELRTKGFALAFLPPLGAPANAPQDFTIFLAHLGDIPNLVVAAPHLTLEGVDSTLNGVRGRQLADGATIRVMDRSVLATENWFRSWTEIIHFAGVIADPPFAHDDLYRAHAASLKIVRGRTNRALFMVHIRLGPGLDRVCLNFLLPNGLVPRRIIQ